MQRRCGIVQLVGSHVWMVGEAVPDFRIRTPARTLGPEQLRGEWLALLHCTRPCVPGCATCMQRFAALAATLAARECRLVVALDEPDAAIDGLMARQASDPAATWIVGRWDSPPAGPAEATRFAVVDPRGVIRAVAESPNSGPIHGRMLLDLVDRAHGRAVAPRAAEAHVDEAFGCVEWYEFDRRNSH